MANYIPLWKDVTMGVLSGDFSIYKVGSDGSETLIYSGYATEFPGSSGPVSRASVKLNSILADNMAIPDLPDLGSASFRSRFVQGEFLTTFSGYDGSTQRFLNTFIYDWSYDYGYSYETEWRGISIPINGHLDRNQYLIFSEVDIKRMTIDVIGRDGSNESEDLVYQYQDFNIDFNVDFTTSGAAEDVDPLSGFVILDLREYPDAEWITVNMVSGSGGSKEVRYRILDGCHRYVLYYTNAYGGWDTFLLEGMCSENDLLTRHTSRQVYSNRTARSRGVFNFCNEIVKQWTLRTGWLSDDASSKMHHLLNSTSVYLYDLETRQMVPVILTDTETEYKTYRNSGHRLVSYEIVAQLAQTRDRR